MKSLLRFGLLCWLSVLSSSPSSATDDKPIAIRINQNITTARSTINITVRIPRHPDNRLWVLAIDGEGFNDYSDTQLDGEESPIIFIRQRSMIPPGEYEVRAVLFRMTKGKQVEFTDRTRLIVME